MSPVFRRGQRVCRRGDPSRVYIVAGQSGIAVDVSIVDGAFRRYTTINADELELAATLTPGGDATAE
ncbi:MAG: hypothetical protein JNM30_01270 [Rhodospirillales bacterium]|nr:hypothetical protein [Rhodospirillales bacterium]